MLLIWSTVLSQVGRMFYLLLENIGPCVKITWNYFPCLVLHKVKVFINYVQTSRRQKYFTGHSVWWRAIFQRTESKFAGPKFWQIKVKEVLLLHFLAIANTISIILRHAVSSLKKIFVPVAAEDMWDVFMCILLFHCLEQLRPFFSCNQFQTCSGLYTTTRIVLFVHTCMS